MLVPPLCSTAMCCRLAVIALALLLTACSGLPRFWHAEPSYHVVHGRTLVARVVDMGQGIYDVQVMPWDPAQAPAAIEEGHYVEAATDAVRERCAGMVSLMQVFRFGAQAGPIVRLKCVEGG